MFELFLRGQVEFRRVAMKGQVISGGKTSIVKTWVCLGKTEKAVWEMKARKPAWVILWRANT